jgi:GT2 family glycosyltransferase
MTSPLLTVVIPTYARPQQLTACLAALVGQRLEVPWEVVVVDDGSPEPLDSIAEAFHERLDLRIERQGNAGPARARNRGVAVARGRFIAFTDDDCLPEPDWLGALLHRESLAPGAIVGGTTINGLDGELFASASQLIVDLVYDHFNADPSRATFLTSNNILCSRERFEAIGGFDVTFPRAGAEDRDFCDRWQMAGWPLIWEPAARIEHRHTQSLRKFIDLHFRYGRGAYLHHRRRLERGSGGIGRDIGFHASIMPRLRALRGDRRVAGRTLAILAAFGIWQGANAAGFAREALLGSRRPPLS